MVAPSPENAPLTPGQMARAQRRFYWFSAFNALSFMLLSGNIITLYTLRLGATTFLIGILASFIPLAQLLPALGRYLVPKLGLTRLMGVFWLIRYLVMIPILFAPILFNTGRPSVALAICVVAVLGFNVARGLGLTANQPLFGSLAKADERGSFLARIMLIVPLCSVPTGVAMAALLGQDAPLAMYSVFMAAGIIFGVLAALQLFRLPEPQGVQPQAQSSLLADLTARLKEQGFRRYLIIVLISAFSNSMVAPFLILFMKQVYSQPDSYVIYFVVIGSLGAIVMSLINGFLIDRLGAKPLYFLYSALTALVLIPLALAPTIESVTVFWVYAALIFLFFNLGLIGTMSTGQVYFFGLIDEADRLNMGIVYFIVSGGAAGLGSIAGGAVLERLGTILPTTEDVYRAYFGALFLAFVVIMILVSRLHSLGAYPIRSAFAIIFSPRDLRAIGLLRRLRKSRTVSQEQELIRELGQSPSQVSVKELVPKLSSPRFVIRTEALRAIGDQPLSRTLENVLVSQVKNHHFTTAHLAAEIIGERRVRRGTKVLRQALSSGDPFLAGKAMVALARLGDRDSIAEIRNRLERSTNPRLIIHAALALEIFREVSSIPFLLRKLEKKTSPFVRDEIILAIAAILGIDDFFHPLYNSFLESGRDGIAALIDLIRDTRPWPEGVGSADELIKLVQTKKRTPFAEHAVEILQARDIRYGDHDLGALLIPALEHPVIGRLERFGYLVASILVWHACRAQGHWPQQHTGAQS